VGVPELREVFETFPDVRLNIEIKQAEPSIVQPLCNMIREFGRADDVLVASFYADTVREFRDACPEVATSGTESEIRAFFVLNTIGLGKVFQPNAQAFQVPEYSGMLHVVTDHFLAGAHRHNIDVHVWTVDDPADMQRLIDLGVDGIITNRPDLLLELLGRLPPDEAAPVEP
jgi:glycerophosphoryl diester phosphodiesterase